MLWAGLITGGEGLYIFGSAVLVGLGRSPFGLSKTLPGASNKDKRYRSLSKFLQRHLIKQDILSSHSERLNYWPVGNTLAVT